MSKYNELIFQIEELIDRKGNFQITDGFNLMFKTQIFILNEIDRIEKQEELAVRGSSLYKIVENVCAKLSIKYNMIIIVRNNLEHYTFECSLSNGLKPFMTFTIKLHVNDSYIDIKSKIEPLIKHMRDMK